MNFREYVECPRNVGDKFKTGPNLSLENSENFHKSPGSEKKTSFFVAD